MKEKKPFKLGATYKLKKRYVDELQWTDYMFELYGEKRVFTFTVGACDNALGLVYCVNQNGGDVAVACTFERHMFKRVDNK